MDSRNEGKICSTKSNLDINYLHTNDKYILQSTLISSRKQATIATIKKI